MTLLRNQARLISWVIDNLGVDTPCTFTRFHPDFQMQEIPANPYSNPWNGHLLAKEKGLSIPIPWKCAWGMHMSKRGVPIVIISFIGRSGYTVGPIHLHHGRVPIVGKRQGLLPDL
jgi:pyruvate formate lyase activating enzyme